MLIRLIMMLGMVASIQLYGQSSFGDDPNQSSTLTDYSLPLKNKDGELAYVIHGKEALIQGDLITLEGVEIKILEKGVTKAIIRTPKITYSQSKKIGYSKATIVIRAGHQIIKGDGYDIDLIEETFSIRSKTRTIIQNFKSQSLEEIPKRN